MTLENKMISTRQGFRMGILENISLGMVVIPYATLNLAGRWHFIAFLIGLALGGIYMGIIYFLSERLVPRTSRGIALFGTEGHSSGDINNQVIFSSGLYGRAVSILYALRFVLRAGLIMFFFGKTVQEFLLQSFNLWIIIIAFILVCGYGASRDIEKRGRMLELLFPWMIIPIILVAVFCISNINLEELYAGLVGENYERINDNVGNIDVLKAGYVAFLITTSTELSLFTLPHQKDRNWRNALKTGLWILISILLAYIFIIGILGGHWVASDSQAALNVMEAAFIPGGLIERADYPVLAFWIIGVFAVISGYMFFAKEAFLSGTGLRDKKSGKLGLWIVMLAVVVLAFLWSLKDVSKYFALYMLWADVIISLLIPGVAILLKGRKNASGATSIRNKISLFLVMVGGAFLMTGCNMEQSSGNFGPLSKEQASIENRDYVTSLTLNGDDELVFTVADIKKYLTDATGSVETKEEKLKGDSLSQVMESYYQSKGRQLDVGHLSGISFKGVTEDKIIEYVIEMSKNTQMGKSVTVTIEMEDDSEKVEISLRQLIKKVYAGENFL